MAFTYKYRCPGIVKAPVEVTGRICQEIIDQDGAVTPKRLIDVSRPEDAPLHNEFEWDDGVAAEKFREEQARQIIKNVIIVDSSIEEERTIKAEIGDRAFVPTDERLHRYVNIATAIDNDKWRENLLNQARKDMYAFRAKYFRLTELQYIIKDIDDFLGA